MKKFTFIGAGSLDFTKDLVRDILTFEAFRDAELMLMDIDPKRLEYAVKGVQKIVDAGKYPAVVKGTQDRKEALKDADGVLITILQGGVEVWRHDIEIPKKYNVDICVGDTRGPSGIFRFLRTAPVLLDIIRDCEEVCPNAVVLNYTNPMAMLVSYLQSMSDMNITGLCHSVQGTAEMLAKWIGAEEKQVRYTCAGINHQAFYLDFEVDGKDAYPDLYKAIEREEVAAEEPVRIEMFKKLGYFNTESSGHNSEYVAWFRKRPDLIEKYCTHGTGWNPGAYGFILDEYLGREDTWEKEYTDWLENGEVDLERGEEYASNIFNAVFGDHTPYFFNGNLKNHGYITNVKQGVCVEVPTVATEAGIVPIKQITLPDHLAVLVNNSALIEDLAVKAAIEGVRIKLETFPYDEFESKVQTALIDGEGGADIYELWGGWALDFTPYGTLMELPEEMAEKVREENYEPTYGALEYEDKMYGIPLEYNIEYGGMLVNDTLLKAKGLTVPKTWEELRKTAIEGTEHDGNIFQCKGFDFVNWDSVPYYFLAFILQQDADYMTADGKFDVTTDAAKTAFNELATMVTEDKVTDLEGLTGGADMEGYQQLYAGRNMIVPRGPWTISEGEQSFGLKLGTDFDYAAMPQYGNNQKFASENGWSLAVSSSCKEQEIALKFLEYLYQDDVMLEHNIRCTQIPAKKSLAQSEEYKKEVPYADVLVGILDQGQFIGNFNTDRLKETINNTFVSYCSGEYGSLDEAMEDMNTKLNGILE